MAHKMAFSGVVMCAKCGKAVDSIRVYEDPEVGVTRYEVYCHGEKEEMYLTAEQVEDSYGVYGGMAFQENKIEKQE